MPFDIGIVHLNIRRRKDLVDKIPYSAVKVVSFRVRGRGRERDRKFQAVQRRDAVAAVA